jgi:hypothetical protein
MKAAPMEAAPMEVAASTVTSASETPSAAYVGGGIDADFAAVRSVERLPHVVGSALLARVRDTDGAARNSGAPLTAALLIAGP